MTIVFEEAERSYQKPRWKDRLLPLMEHPGEWVRVHVSETANKARVYAWALTKQGERYNLPPGRFEFKYGDLDDGQGAVYARFLGEA